MPDKFPIVGIGASAGGIEVLEALFRAVPADSGEELQSTNEDIQTSKEEFQSVNEELRTVNAQLNNKIDELNNSNTDLNDIFDGNEERHAAGRRCGKIAAARGNPPATLRAGVSIHRLLMPAAERSG